MVRHPRCVQRTNRRLESCSCIPPQPRGAFWELDSVHLIAATGRLEAILTESEKDKAWSGGFIDFVHSQDAPLMRWSLSTGHMRIRLWRVALSMSAIRWLTLEDPCTSMGLDSDRDEYKGVWSGTVTPSHSSEDDPARKVLSLQEDQSGITI